MPAAAGEETTLLIDGDVVAFQAAASAQEIHEDSFGYVQPFANRAKGEAIVDSIMLSLEAAFKSSHFRVALSDPKENWRKSVMPSYKANRKDSVRPLLLDILKQYLRDSYGAFHWAGLEADDVLGILNTEPQDYPGKRILAGKDKDFKTVPGFYHRLKDFDLKGKPVVQEITPWEAQRFHLYQTLKGDAVDGYGGCPGMGETRTWALLDAPVRLSPKPSPITRGPRKGETTTKWCSEPTQDYWAMVVTHYQKAGLTEVEALQTARVAHILRHEDYNRETEEIRLWTPDRLMQS